jgi:hypothetical protein
MKTARLNVRISESRLAKFRRIADRKEKTMTQLIEDWIDKLKEEKPSAEEGALYPFLPTICAKRTRIIVC